MLPLLSLKQAIDKTVREEWGRILASLTKSLGDLQLAEDCLQEAVISAMSHWEKNGLPKSPAAWLIQVARRKAIDHIRRDKNFASKQSEIAHLIELENNCEKEQEAETLPDKRLEMIFTCCHPALEEKAKIALTLRTLGGLTTQEIASAFLDKPEAMAQRLVRAKKKISAANIPYQIPHSDDLPERITSVLSVIYLIFNEGYFAKAGDHLTRADLCKEAIRLARIIYQLTPPKDENKNEITGLLALMLLHDSRRHARTDKSGKMVSLEEQNRSRWDKAKIDEGTNILKQALAEQKIGPYQLQAAISALHAQAASWSKTDWPQIVELYSLLNTVQPSPVVRINRAIAISYAQSIQTALEILEAEAKHKKLENYQPYFAAKADLLNRAGQHSQAKTYFEKAIELSENEQEIKFLQNKMHFS